MQDADTITTVRNQGPTRGGRSATTGSQETVSEWRATASRL